MYCNGITITEGSFVESTRPRCNSLTTTNSPSKKLIPPPNDYLCRICLDHCEPIHYCQCTGGMMCHQQCLLEYLNNKTENSETPHCQVCKQPYTVVTTRSCYCSQTKLQSRIKAKPIKCLLYVLYFVFTVSVYGYLMRMLVDHQLKPDLVTVAIAVLACLTIMFVFFMVIWSCDYPIVTEDKVMEVMPRRPRRKGTMEISVEEML